MRAVPVYVGHAVALNVQFRRDFSRAEAVALLARNWGSVLQAGLSIASIIYGSLLGVFLLGLLTKRVGEIAAICGMIAGLGAMLYVRFATPIAFTWYVLIGTSVTFLTGLLTSIVFKEPPRAAE